jgi:hypothetical protein
MWLIIGASEASAGSAWGWGPVRNQIMLIESAEYPHLSKESARTRGYLNMPFAIFTCTPYTGLSTSWVIAT